MGNTLALRHGEFFGRRQSRRTAGGFVFSELTPTLPEHAVREHAHDDAHFVLLCEGAYVSTAAGAPAVATTPLLIYNPPGTVHRDRFRGEGGRFFTVSCDARFVIDAGERLSRQTIVLSREAMLVAARLRRECMQWDAASAVLAESQALVLLGVAAAPLQAPDGMAPWLRRAREMLDDHWADALGIADVASAVGVHPVHLARRFRSRYGLGPGEYSRSIRLQRAADLLRRSKLPVGEIGLRCGFGDASQFARAFLRWQGQSPRAYRAQFGMHRLSD